MKCTICDSKTIKEKIITRAKKKQNIFICNKCDFEFFLHNPYEKLRKNKLDISRLTKAGIKIDSITNQFKHGQIQSKNYIKQYLNNNDKKKRVLDIGCSYGYFLYEIKKFGCKPYGVELNQKQKYFIKKKLKIRCEENIEKYQKENLTFDKVFLFYSLEYIPNPVNYISNLIQILSVGGEVIIITPNKNDILKRVIDNQNYKNFFYDENSINYFSIKSLEKIMKLLKVRKYKIKTNQGYSLINLFNWYVNGKPMKSSFVGEDNFFEDFLKKIKISKDKKNKNNTKKIKNEMLKFFVACEKNYEKILEKNRIGNQIILKIKK